jgi:hypothetical protein
MPTMNNNDQSPTFQTAQAVQSVWSPDPFARGFGEQNKGVVAHKPIPSFVEIIKCVLYLLLIVCGMEAVHGAPANKSLGTGSDYSAINGGYGNSIWDFSPYAVIAGGMNNLIRTNSDYAAISGGSANLVTYESPYSTIGGGWFNAVAGTASTVSGGRENRLFPDYGVISGGYHNSILASSFYSFIGGGHQNMVGQSAPYGSVVGGFANVIGNYSGASAICGGEQNRVADYCNWVAIGGGYRNDIADGADYSIISGGYDNEVYPDSDFAMIPGGRLNSATSFAFAAGHRAKANHAGSFVWADSRNYDFSSTVANGFFARATGGVKFVTGINGSGGEAAGVRVVSGASAWTTLSDRHSKENVEPVDTVGVLERLARIPINTWNWKAQEESIRHMGPMAQDFSAAFNVGEDDTHISTVDADGVALAAIQGLNQKVEIGKQKAEVSIKELRAENAELKQTVNELKELVQAMNHKLTGIAR